MTGDTTGTLALVGGAEWREGCRKFDAALLEAAGTDEVLVLPTAAAFENPGRAVETARRYFDELGAHVSGLMVLGRTEAEDPTNAAVVRASRFVYIGGGSPMHLRSVLKGSRLWEALVEAWNDGAVLVGIDEQTALLRDPDGGWRVAGQGSVTLYGPGRDEVAVNGADSPVDRLPPG